VAAVGEPGQSEQSEPDAEDVERKDRLEQRRFHLGGGRAVPRALDEQLLQRLPVRRLTFVSDARLWELIR